MIEEVTTQPSNYLFRKEKNHVGIDARISRRRGICHSVYTAYNQDKKRSKDKQRSLVMRIPTHKNCKAIKNPNLMI